MNEDSNSELDRETTVPSAAKTAPINWSLWAPPLILVCTLLIILIYLLVPGNLIYPPKKITSGQIEIDGKTHAQLKQNLQTRVSELENLLRNGQCTAEGLSLPDKGFSLLPPLLSTPENQGDRSAMLPPPNQLSSLDSSTSIADFLTNSVVFIATDDGFGTGFFIDQNRIVTNRHVIENVQGVVKVFKPNGVESFDASIIGMSEDFSQSNEDFALLLSAKPSESFLKFSRSYDDLSLTPVISAGYQGDVLETIFELDQDGKGVLNDGIPLFLTSGTINAVQKFKDKGAILLHSADISQGNSGGPLVNACGEVLGINTFTRSDQVRTLNIALSIDGLDGFLGKYGVKLGRSKTSCIPKAFVSNEDQQ
jgi:hypothetical protein